MKVETKLQQSPQLFSTLEDTLNQSHPLCKLSNLIDWKMFEDAFRPLYKNKDVGRPAKPIRLMCGLLILKHVRNLSDEAVVEQWSENVYYQYFCGATEFIPGTPCDATELIYFRKRIGEEGIELILKESIRINQRDNDDNPEVVFIDSTVQDKNITYPTDSKLRNKIISECLSIAKKENIVLRQTYTRTIKKLKRDQRFRTNPKNRQKARKADKKIKTIAGRLVRDLDRKLPSDSCYRDKLELFHKILSQTRTSKDKIYSIHEPSTLCISKGKEHKKYEFGNKVSILWSEHGVIVGAKSFRNEYDGHTIPDAINQYKRLTNKKPKLIAGDRGYRGVKEIDGIKVIIPKPSSKSQSKQERDEVKKIFKKRAGIEPVIGHLKRDHRLGRNFYKGLLGDSINVMLAAAAFNFKRVMNALLCLIFVQLNSNKLEQFEIKYA